MTDADPTAEGPAQAPKPSRKSRSSPRWIADKVKSTLLVLFTAAIGCVSIYFLSAILAQTRLSSITIDGSALSIWKLSYVGQQWADLRRQRETQVAAKAEVEKQRDDFSSMVIGTQEKWSQKWSQVGPLLDLVAQRASHDYPDLVVTDPNHATEVIVKILARRTELQTHYAELTPVIDAIDKGSDSYRAVYEDLSRVREQSKWILLQISNLTDSIVSRDAELTQAVTSFKPSMDEGTRNRIENAFYELYASDPSAWGYLQFVRRFWDVLLTMQPDTLTLWLVLAMGVLGSSLQVTHASFKSGVAVTMGVYFLRLSVGALTALIIFIVAKAGVPVIADAGRIGGDGTINPYFVSFLAIISGLLSENAIANIQAQGARIFGQAAATQTRWTRTDLTDELPKQSVDLKQLAEALGESEDRTKDMLKGVAGMAPEQQRVLALALRGNARDLLTDIPPPAPAPAAQPS